jgi:hypothetical protein
MSKVTETGKGETGEERSQEDDHNFLWRRKEFVMAG